MSISQEMRYRESIVKYAKRFSVKRAAAQFNISPATIYRWIKRYEAGNENLRALASNSRRPNSHPRAHTAAEIKLIRDIKRRNPNIGLQDLWIKLRKRGYKRSMSGLSKELHKLGLSTHPQSQPSPTCSKKARAFDPMTRPGERVQIDVKFVPKACLAPEFIEKYSSSELYQYTAIDEYSRYRILWCSRKHDSYESSCFLSVVVNAFKALGIEIECVQTDNGAEFTKRFKANNINNHSMFEAWAKHLGVKVRHIKPHTPKHNGKVERSHREDQKNLYSEIIRLGHLITDEDSFQRKLKRYQDRSNDRPMRPLGYKTPKQMLEGYLEQHPKTHDEQK